MSDLLGVLFTVVLLAANAFFVAAEFALISARRDRLEALAEQGKNSAVAVIRAGENLPLMLAGAQLGITVCSILLGRVTCWRSPSSCSACPTPCCTPCPSWSRSRSW
jgi:CBS domain containing-hemolysin-like protein